MKNSKDIKIHVGQNNVVAFSFYNESWKRFTDNDRIAIWSDGDRIAFEAVGHLTTIYRKLQSGTVPTTRYCQVKGNPEIVRAAEKLEGYYSVEEFLKLGKEAFATESAAEDDDLYKKIAALLGLCRSEPERVAAWEAIGEIFGNRTNELPDPLRFAQNRTQTASEDGMKQITHPATTQAKIEHLEIPEYKFPNKLDDLPEYQFPQQQITTPKNPLGMPDSDSNEWAAAGGLSDLIGGLR